MEKELYTGTLEQEALTTPDINIGIVGGAIAAWIGLEQNYAQFQLDRVV